LKHGWDRNDWLYEGKHGFRPGYSVKVKSSHFAKTTYISYAFDLVPQGHLLSKLAASGVESKIVVWVREFFVDLTQRVSVGRQLHREVKLNSVVQQGIVFGPLLFLVYVNDILRNIESLIRLFADNCIIYRKITNKKKT